MKLGLVYPQIELGGDPDAVRTLGRGAEALGYDYLLAYDHVFGADHMVICQQVIVPEFLCAPPKRSYCVWVTAQLDLWINKSELHVGSLCRQRRKVDFIV